MDKATARPDPGHERREEVYHRRRLAEIVFHVWHQERDYFTVVRHGVVRGLSSGR
jgi:hypothetical protein